jgi:hypothetical protein
MPLISINVAMEFCKPPVAINNEPNMMGLGTTIYLAPEKFFVKTVKQFNNQRKWLPIKLIKE